MKVQVYKTRVRITISLKQYELLGFVLDSFIDGLINETTYEKERTFANKLMLFQPKQMVDPKEREE